MNVKTEIECSPLDALGFADTGEKESFKATVNMSELLRGGAAGEWNNAFGPVFDAVAAENGYGTMEEFVFTIDIPACGGNFVPVVSIK